MNVVFLKEKGIMIVTFGSTASHVEKHPNAWVLRDATGRPLAVVKKHSGKELADELAEALRIARVPKKGVK
jgi:hypothetical protein